MKHFKTFQDFVGEYGVGETDEQKRERIRKERLKKLSRIMGENVEEERTPMDDVKDMPGENLFEKFGNYFNRK